MKKTLILILLIILTLILIIFITKISNHMNIEKEKDTVQQLTETTNSNSYITLEKHLSELGENIQSLKGKYHCTNLTDSSGTINVTVPSDCKYGILIVTTYKFNSNIIHTINNQNGIKNINTIFKNLDKGSSISPSTSTFICDFEPNEIFSVTYESNYGGNIFIIY